MPQPQIDRGVQEGLFAKEARADWKQKMDTWRAQIEAESKVAQAEVERELQRRATKAAMDDANRKVEEKRQAEEQKARQQAQGGKTDKGLTTDWKNVQTNPQNVQPEELTTSPGGGVGPFPSGPNVAGSTDDMGLPGVGQAPPFLVSQRRTSEVGPHRFSPYFTAPARTTRRTTDIQPNVMRPGERVRALQENWRLKQAQETAQQKELEDTITTEAVDLGGTLFSEKEGEIAEGSTEARFGELVARYGKAMATRILVGARAQSRGLELERRKAKYGSDLVEGRAKRGAARRKAEKSGAEARPSAIEKDRAAEIRLKILEGKPIKPKEQRFLDKVERANVRDVIVRDALSSVNNPSYKATQEDVTRIEEETGIKDANELRIHMESIGYVFD